MEHSGWKGRITDRRHGAKVVTEKQKEGVVPIVTDIPRQRRESFPVGIQTTHERFLGQFLLDPHSSGSIPIPPHRLTPAKLRTIYKQTSAVRASVDSVTRAVTTLPWTIIPTPRNIEDIEEAVKAKWYVEPLMVDYVHNERLDPSRLFQSILGGETKKTRHQHISIDEETREQMKVARAFFSNPNSNDELFQQILRKVLTDIMVLDAGFIEKIFDLEKTVLLEIMARDGATFVPRSDQFGNILFYDQIVQSFGKRDTRRFANDEVIHFILYPQSNSLVGMPIIDSIVDEVSFLLLSMDHIAGSMIDDEVPPGILSLGKIGDEAYERLKASFLDHRGPRSDMRIKILSNIDGDTKWIPFTKPNRDMQTKELRDAVERIVFRNFGVTPVEMGMSEINRATGEIQVLASESKLITPLVELLTIFLNHEILDMSGFHNVRLVFRRPPVGNIIEFAKVVDDLTGSGVLNINEARRQIGEDPVKGGDRNFIKLGNEIVFIDDESRLGLAGGESEEEETNGSADKSRKGPENGGLLPSRTPSSEAPPVPTGEKHVLRFDEESLARRIAEIAKQQEEDGPKHPFGTPPELLAIPRSIDDAAIQRAMTGYDVEIRQFYRELRKRILNAVVGELVVEPQVGRRVQVSVLRPTRAMREIDRQMTITANRMQGAAKRWFPKAINIGMESAKKALDGAPQRTPRKKIDAILQERLSWNERFLKSSWMNDLRAKINRMITEPQLTKAQEQFDVEKSGEEQVEKAGESSFMKKLSAAVDGQEHRSLLYAGGLTSVANKSFVAEGFSHGKFVHWVDVGDKIECETCIARAQGSPYTEDDIPGVPGEDTICNGRCRCVMVFLDRADPLPVPVPVEESEPDVSTKTIVSTKRLGKAEGVNESTVVEFDDGTRALFKPKAGEHEVLVAQVGGPLYKREVAASELDKLWELDLVPETVKRTVKGKVGSIQAWVENADVAGETGMLGNSAVGWSSHRQMSLFDVIIGNTDRHRWNWMIMDDVSLKQVVAIDNGAAFPSRLALGQMPPDFSLAVRESANKNFVEKLLTTTREDLEKAVGDLLNKEAFDILELRISQVQEAARAAAGETL